jgi:hypothetical protein
MENTPKKYGKTISFIPLIAFTLWTIYFLIVNKRLIEHKSFQDHLSVMSDMLQNYGGLFWGLALCCVITTFVMLYFTVHLARLRRMNAATKIGWLVFMVCFGAFSFPIFYYLELRNEPNNVETYPDIA